MDQMVSKINPRPVLLAGMILLAGCYRLFIASGVLPPLPNFTPLGAMALFGGCYYQDKWKAYLVPLLSLWLTDILLNRFFYFGEWVFFYDRFAWRSEEHTSELQSRPHLVCRLLLETKNRRTRGTG